jgi:hypothetical protein
MIRHASDNDWGGNADPNEAYRRDFQKILDASISFFAIVTTDEANHLADGIISGSAGNGYKATLAYNGKRRLVKVILILSGVVIKTPEQFRALFQVQETTPLARFEPDPEEQALRLSAASACPDPNGARRVMCQIRDSIQTALADSRLKGLL